MYCVRLVQPSGAIRSRALPVGIDKAGCVGIRIEVRDVPKDQGKLGIVLIEVIEAKFQHLVGLQIEPGREIEILVVVGGVNLLARRVTIGTSRTIDIRKAITPIAIATHDCLAAEHLSAIGPHIHARAEFGLPTVVVTSRGVPTTLM